MFKRGKKAWRGSHKWVRSEQVGEPQQSQQEKTVNTDIAPQQEFSSDNFTTGRGGKRRDIRSQNGPDPGTGHSNFGKKPKNSFHNGKNFNSHRGNFNRNDQQQNMHHNPQMHPDYGNQPPQNHGGDNFAPTHMPMDNVPFRCTMCGKPFKKEVLRDMHLKTECKAMMNPQGPSNQPSHFPADNFHRGENHFQGQRTAPRRRGAGRRGGSAGRGFNQNLHNPHDDSSNAENPESWNEFSNDDGFGNAQENFSSGDFPQQNTFRGSRGRGRGRGRGFHQPPYRGGQMEPRPTFNLEYHDNSQNPPDNHFHGESYDANQEPYDENQQQYNESQQQYDENSNGYDNPVENQFHYPNKSARRNRPRNFPLEIVCNLCNVQVNSFEELHFHKEKFHLKCKFCVAFFATMTDLYMHQETHLTEDSPKEENEQHGQLPCPPPFPLPEDSDQNSVGFNGPDSGMGEMPPPESIPEQVILYPCCLCILNFSVIEELAEHICIAHPPATVCSECGCVFKDEDQLQGHVKYEHGTEIFPEKERLAILAHTDFYPCEICSEVQCNPVALQYHMHFHRVHTILHEPKSNRQPYIACPECNVLIKSNGLKNHILNNHNLVTCNVCQQVFSDKHVYCKHVDLDHYPNCVCNICCLICFNNNALQQHGATEHAMGEMFKCGLCGKRFGMKTLLDVHELLHPELNNQCKVCGEFFKMPDMMLEFRSHMVEIHGLDSSMFV